MIVILAVVPPGLNTFTNTVKSLVFLKHFESHQIIWYKYVFMYINIHIYKQVVYLKYMQGKIVNYTPVKLGKKI